MAEPFLAEIRIVAFGFPPMGYAQCDGGILPINQNQSLFSLLGTSYGGDGQTSFALPDLRGRTPIHAGDSETPGSIDHPLGQRAGTETHVLTEAEMPPHKHAVWGKDGADETEPGDDRVMGRGEVNVYRTPGTSVAMGTGVLGDVVSPALGQGHDNMQPYLALNFLIAIQGTFPPAGP